MTCKHGTVTIIEKKTTPKGWDFKVQCIDCGFKQWKIAQVKEYFPWMDDIPNNPWKEGLE